ncbi:MAG: response regulator transcription factor [Coriobacteriales bacterium]|jgi:DNA-binding response OmpR family regulator|nr:response regulator transcription factor [Coriobacteriales bacterium]
MNILLVEDQPRLNAAIAEILRKADFKVESVYDGQAGYDYARSGEYDVVVLDVMLPGIDGFEVVRRLRGENCATPVIMLTAKSTLSDKVEGLNAGADDYLTKPFQPAELIARIKAMTRRKGNIIIDTVSAGNTTLNLNSADLSSSGSVSAGAGTLAEDAATVDVNASVHLSHREFDVCKYLIVNIGQVFDKQTLLKKVWGTGSGVDQNSVEAYISFLRKKLAYIGSDLEIQTVRSMGYRMQVAQ